MMTRNCGKQMKFHTLTIENLVPEDHFLRKLDRLVDFSYYCHHNGQPNTNPVILVKYLLVGYLYSIESEQRRRFGGENLFHRLFEHILGLCMERDW